MFKPSTWRKRCKTRRLDTLQLVYPFSLRQCTSFYAQALFPIPFPHRILLPIDLLEGQKEGKKEEINQI